WLKNYQAGVNSEIDPSQYHSLVEYAESCFNEFNDRTAYVNMGKSISYQALDHLSQCFANYLRCELKLKKGDRVAIMLPNVLQYPVAMVGIHRAGLVVVNLNPLYTARELEYVLNDCEASTIIVLTNFAHTLQKALPKTQIKHIILTQIGDLLGTIKGNIINFVVKNFKKMVPNYHLPQAEHFNKVLTLGKRHTYQKPNLTHEDIAYLQYTGGTTGRAKGAILTHRNMVANVLQATEWINPLVQEKLEGGIITALPLYHIFSLTANCLTFLKVGIPNILITNPRDIPGFVKELKKHPFAVITGVNTLFNALLHNKDFASCDFSKFRFALGGGMAVQKAVAQKWQKVTGIPLVEAYGLTEASPAVTINPMDTKEFNGSIGLPIPSTEISIRDDHENELPIGESGELCVKGPQVMRGYWNDEEKTKLVFTEDGWLKTGDIATIDAQGYIRIVDRKKDMITISGFKVYPNEVEDVIASIPGVKEVAIIGIPDSEHGERVRAYVVKSDETLTEQTILTTCKENLTHYKIPKEIVFRAELPKTNVGKVLRRALREDILREHSLS
ncbi:MAG TPA: AMP-binding protein, partial [Gammaproteobacteria bacterium]|nr:AMP-binding protein [Gammaproteobacteria bacterium]